MEDYLLNKQLDLESIVETTSIFFFYFINFGPISHGVYQAGLACWYSFLLAFDQIILNSIPKDVLLDWEVYLSDSPFLFYDFLKSYLNLFYWIFNIYDRINFPQIELEKDLVSKEYKFNKLISSPKSIFQILNLN